MGRGGVGWGGVGWGGCVCSQASRSRATLSCDSSYYLMLIVCVLSYFVQKIYIKCCKHELSLLPI